MNREKRVANIFLLIFGGISVILLSLPLTGKVRAFREFASYVYDPLPYYGGQGIEKLNALPVDVARLISADARVRELEEELRRHELQRAENDALRRENARLAGELSLSTTAPTALRWAHVMERDPQGWNRSLIVDAGETDGVELNAPVMASCSGRLCVVGRIVETAARTSKVLLLTDELSAVAAYMPASQWEGLVQGQGTSRMRMNYLSVEAQPRVGEDVVTSPTSATFPADLPIGTVSRVFDRDPFLAFQTVEVSPAAPASRLKEVLILRRKKRGDS